MANEQQVNKDLYADALKVFRRVAPEFRNMPDEDTEEEGVVKYGVVGYMDLYADQVSCRRFGSTYPKALAYLTAHKLKMLDMGEGYGDGNSGGSDGLGSMGLALRIASASEGETSVSFRGLSSSGSSGGVSDVDADLELTVYGMEFLKLRRNAIIPIVSAAEPLNNEIPGYPHTPECVNKNQGE